MEDYAGIYGAPVPFFESDWTIVYPVFMRTVLMDSASYKYTDTLVYVASSKESAVEWCKRNVYLEPHNDAKDWWWFVVTQEAIDGDYSGIKGVVNMLDWNAEPIITQPLSGYKKEEPQ